jgi:hypothetical protein
MSNTLDISPRHVAAATRSSSPLGAQLIPCSLPTSAPDSYSSPWSYLSDSFTQCHGATSRACCSGGDFIHLRPLNYVGVTRSTQTLTAPRTLCIWILAQPQIHCRRTLGFLGHQGNPLEARVLCRTQAPRSAFSRSV